MEIKPIKTDEDYQTALAEIDCLFDASPNTPEADRLEVLMILVQAYEREHFDTSLPDPIEAIEYYVESRGLSRLDLEPCIGSRARVSEILNRRRPLTLRMIRNLEAGLGIPAEILIQQYDLVLEGVDEILAYSVDCITASNTYQGEEEIDAPLQYMARVLSIPQQYTILREQESFSTGDALSDTWDEGCVKLDPEKKRFRHTNSCAYTSAPVQ